jgi:DNA-binding response OmpR family regulator
MLTAETEFRDRQRPNELSENVYDDGYLRVEHGSYYVACGGQPIYLPRTEFLLISRLARSVDRVVSAKDLWQDVRGLEKPFNVESLHAFIYRLRIKLLPYQVRIETVVSVGYRLAVSVSSASCRRHREREP